MNNQLTAEQIVTLQLRIMSALSFYQQRPEKEAKKMAELLTLAGAAASELQERRNADVTRNSDDRPTPKSDLRQFAEKIADDLQGLINLLPDTDQGGA